MPLMKKYTNNKVNVGEGNVVTEVRPRLEVVTMIGAFSD